jgi:hypothetical protein
MNIIEKLSAVNSFFGVPHLDENHYIIGCDTMAFIDRNQRNDLSNEQITA